MPTDKEWLHSKQMQTMGKLSEAVAHDINNMLSGIMGYSEVLLEENSAANLKPFIEEILKTSKRIVSLTRLLLIFRDSEYHPEILNLNNLILELQKYISIAIGPKMDFHALLQPELWAVKADSIQIRKLLLIIVADLTGRILNGRNFVIETKNMSFADLPTIAGTLAPGRYVRITVEAPFEIPPARPNLNETPYLEYLGVSEIVTRSGGLAYHDSQTGKASRIEIYLPVQG